jgi:hypothetical protein
MVAMVVLVLLLVSSGIRSIVAATMGVFVPRYRRTARIYGSVFWSLLVRNPMTTKGWRFGTAASPESARLKGLTP